MTISANVEAAQLPWRPLGELFVGRGLISEAELETALAEQAATGRRLGEILVERGLVSGPDLTSALMDQLGVEISKEEGFGSGLWAEIKRRHKRVRRDEDDEGEAFEALSGGQAEIALVPPPVEPGTFEAPPFEFEAVSPESAFEPELQSEWDPEPVVQLEPQPEPEPEAEADPVIVGPELEQELAEIKAEYTPPDEREPEPEPELELELVAVPEPALDFAPAADPEFELESAAVAVPESLTQPEPMAEPEPVDEQPEAVAHEPEAAGQGPELVAEVESVDEAEREPVAQLQPEPEPEQVAESDDAAALRAELESARTDLAHLQEMLADAMTALTALSGEAAGEQYAGE